MYYQFWELKKHERILVPEYPSAGIPMRNKSDSDSRAWQNISHPVVYINKILDTLLYPRLQQILLLLVYQ